MSSQFYWFHRTLKMCLWNECIQWCANFWCFYCALQSNKNSVAGTVLLLPDFHVLIRSFSGGMLICLIVLNQT